MDEELEFQGWYKAWANKAGIDPDPDNPLHKYDYRGAWKAGIEPVISEEDGLYHWDSRFKELDHPNRFVDGIDTITGEKIVPKSKVDQYKYSTGEKVRDIAKWTWEGMVRDSKRALSKLNKASEKLDKAVPPKKKDVEASVIRPNEKAVKERFREEEDWGIKRGKNAWGGK